MTVQMTAQKWCELQVSEEQFAITPVESKNIEQRIVDAKASAFLDIDVALDNGRDIDYVKAIVDGTKLYIQHIERSRFN